MDQPDVSNLITVHQALQIIDSSPVTPRTKHLNFSEALGHHLAEDLLADRDAPPFDKSQMDGYAIRAADLQNIPRELTIVGTISAGEKSDSNLNPGEALSIMTGAPVPRGANVVVPIEATNISADSTRVIINEKIAPGRHIAKQGSDVKAGEIVIKKQTKIGPAQIAVAASVGAVTLSVFTHPSVAVLGTGDELVPPEKTPAGAQIRSCNNAMLMALLRRFPCRPTDLGLIWDDPAAIEQKIALGLTSDVLLVTGGMSMGQRDFVPDILRNLGGNLKITKLRIKPGKPFVFAEMPGGKFVFGLPGNPVSAFVCTIRLVSRLLARIAGGDPQPRIAAAPLAAALEPNGPREFYQPAIFDGHTLTPLKWVGSADIFTLGKASALMIRPENQPALAAGAMIEYLEI